MILKLALISLHIHISCKELNKTPCEIAFLIVERTYLGSCQSSQGIGSDLFHGLKGLKLSLWKYLSRVSLQL